MKNRCHNYISPLFGGTSHEKQIVIIIIISLHCLGVHPMKNRCHNYISPLSGGTSHEQICNTSPVWVPPIWNDQLCDISPGWDSPNNGFMKYVSPLQIWCEQLRNMVWSQNAAPASDFEALGQLLHWKMQGASVWLVSLAVELHGGLWRGGILNTTRELLSRSI